MKKNRIIIYILYLFLLICIVFLVFFPLKNNSSTRLDDGKHNEYLTVQDGDSIVESFTIDVDYLNTIGFLLPFENKSEINGNLSVEIKIDNKSVAIQNYEFTSLKDNIYKFIDFESPGNVKNKICRIEFKIGNIDDKQIIYFSDTKRPNIQLMHNDKTIDGSLAINLFGSSKDYFYVWYPCLALALLFTISSLLLKEGDPNVK